MPAMTVRTNVTAPHSRRSTAQFTNAKFYRRLEIVVVRVQAFLFLLLALVQESDEVLRPRERFPTLREEVLNQDLAVRLLVDVYAPLVERARALDIEVFICVLILIIFVVVEFLAS